MTGLDGDHALRGSQGRGGGRADGPSLTRCMGVQPGVESTLNRLSLLFLLERLNDLHPFVRLHAGVPLPKATVVVECPHNGLRGQDHWSDLNQLRHFVFPFLPFRLLTLTPRAAFDPISGCLSCDDVTIAPLSAAVSHMWAVVWINHLAPVTHPVEVRVLAAQRARRLRDAVHRPTQYAVVAGRDIHRGFFQRACAAFRAISRRCSKVSFFARVNPAWAPQLKDGVPPTTSTASILALTLTGPHQGGDWASGEVGWTVTTPRAARLRGDSKPATRTPTGSAIRSRCG